MTRFDSFIGDLEGVIAKLTGMLGGLKQMKEESEAIENARDRLRGRRRRKKDQDSG